MQHSTSSENGPRPWAKATWILVPALAFVALLAFATSRTPGAPEVGDRAPEFEAELLEGEGTLALEDLEGPRNLR